MRTLSILLILLSLVLSCKKDTTKDTINKNPGKLEILSQKDFDDKVEIIDTFCIAETKRAEEDIKNGRLVLSVDNFHVLHGLSLHDKNKSIIKELAKYKVLLDTTPHFHTCIRHRADNFFDTECYNKFMKQEIEKKYGENFINSVIAIVQQNHITSFPDKIFSFLERDIPRDGDLSSPAYDFIKKKTFELDSKLSYPQGYIFNDKRISYVAVTFVLMKDGTVKNIETEIYFHNKQNDRFRDYFDKYFRDYVNRTKWVHPTFHGTIANCDMRFHFNLK